MLKNERKPGEKLYNVSFWQQEAPEQGVKCLTPSQVWGKANIGFSKMENQSKKPPMLVSQKMSNQSEFSSFKKKTRGVIISVTTFAQF